MISGIHEANTACTVERSQRVSGSENKSNTEMQRERRRVGGRGGGVRGVTNKEDRKEALISPKWLSNNS